jgi:ribonuclease P protein component
LAARSDSVLRTFPKTNRILRRSDFRRVYDGGIRFSGPLFMAFCLRSEDPARLPGARVGFTVPRALGKAVIRNRIRRRVREAVRLALSAAGPQWDIVINPRRSVLDAPFEAIQSEVARLFRRCGS